MQGWAVCAREGHPVIDIFWTHLGEGHLPPCVVCGDYTPHTTVEAPVPLCAECARRFKSRAEIPRGAGKCRYCHQAIYETAAGDLRGKYLHVAGDAWGCLPGKIDAKVSGPSCHICGVKEPPHGIICSAAGEPPRHAWPETDP